MTCELAGLQVIETTIGLGGQFLVAMVEVTCEHTVAEFEDDMQSNLGALRTWAAAQKSKDKRIAIWGEGYKSIAAMSAANLSEICYVIDSVRAK